MSILYSGLLILLSYETMVCAINAALGFCIEEASSGLVPPTDVKDKRMACRRVWGCAFYGYGLGFGVLCLGFRVWG